MYKSARAPVRLVFDVIPTPSAEVPGSPTPLVATEAREASSAQEHSESTPERQPQQKVRLDARPGHSPWRGPQASEVQMMFKSGDDLRQDQFVCQVRTQHNLSALPFLCTICSGHGRCQVL